MKKRLLSTLLALCMALTLLPGTAFAADVASGTCGTNVTWTYSDGTLTIQGAGPMSDYTMVTTPWYDYRMQIHTVTIDYGVTTIGEWAFSNFIHLTDVVISNSVTSIGDNAFSFCPNLAIAKIPGSVTTIGNSAFSYCTGLVVADIPSSVTAIGFAAFKCCIKLISVTIPKGVTTIEWETFYNCTNLTSVSIPNSVTSIGLDAFRSTALTSVSIPDSVTAIHDQAFYDCRRLTSVTIPYSVNTIGKSAFFGCGNLKDVSYGGNERQWEEISIDSTANGNAPLLNANIRCTGIPDPIEPEKPAEPAKPSVPAVTFTDVPDWCAGAANWAAEQGIAQGVGNNRFDPNSTCKNTEILTFLWRAAGEQKAASPSPFTVASWYQDAVDWAYEMGLIDDACDPNAPCTRADAVSYIWQVFQKPSAPDSDFPDIPANADYAAAVAWAFENGITDGMGGGLFGPDTTCTRGQIVTFLHRAYVSEARLK